MKIKRWIIAVLGILLCLCGGYYISRYGLTVPEKIELPWGAEIEVPEKVSLPLIGTVAIPGRGKDGSVTRRKVYVTSVEQIQKNGYLGAQNAYSGVVETQELVTVPVDSGRKLLELYVAAGDLVREGDRLFSYDPEGTKEKIEKLDLELEEQENIIQNQQDGLQKLYAEQQKAPAAEKTSVQLEILSAQNELHKQEYALAVKKLERARLEESLSSLTVFSGTDGVVRKIPAMDGSPSDVNYGEGNAVTILKTGDYRIKATVNELNYKQIQVGDRVSISGRTGGNSYEGIVTEVSAKPEASASQNMYGGSSQPGTSRYAFYIRPEEKTDYVLGQHVVLRICREAENPDGIWLPDYYLVPNGDVSSVWKKDASGRITLVPVQTRRRDDEHCLTEIVDGLTARDEIAFPQAFLEEGLTAVNAASGEMQEEIQGETVQPGAGREL